MKKAKEQQLIEILEAKAADHGFELVDVECSGSGHSGTIRVFLDKDGGLSIDDIVAANKWVDAVIEECDPFIGSYTLEVSTPGIDRPLRTAEHFERFAGEPVKIESGKIDGRANWTGILQGLVGGKVCIEIDDTEHLIPLDMIKKAHLKGRIEFS